MGVCAVDGHGVAAECGGRGDGGGGRRGVPAGLRINTRSAPKGDSQRDLKSPACELGSLGCLWSGMSGVPLGRVNT